MKSFPACTAFPALLAAALLIANPARSAQFKFATQTLTVPDGFEIELVAGSPLVDRPVSADFDEQGRLYVTDSSGSNDKVDKQLQEKPHRVVRLEDTDGDGRFDKTTVFADKMMFPEGCLWFNGSVYVGAPPSIWKLTDANNDGVADQREEWFQGKTLTGCANDLHGPYAGPDGWVYWCKGAFAKQTYTLLTPRGPRPLVTRAAHIFRARPDGSGLEPVLTGGMDNPVGLTFTPEGERILCGTFFVHPEAGKRDGLIHAIYGGVYGKDHDVIDDHKKTGELMPIMTHFGAAAPCSVIRYRSQIFGNEFEDNLFTCLFNLHKVTRDVLEPDGATFRTRDSDFVTSDSPDFHPTCVLEDADGSLLVVDTGGWYKICCPTSQLWKPDVLGAIYRVRRQGAPKIDDPRGLKLAWPTAPPADLVKLLGDARPQVRDRAIDQLGQRGAAAISALTEAVKTSGYVETRRNAIWALTRINNSDARAAVRAALNDRDASVRHVALHSVSVWRDADALRPLINILAVDNTQLKRAAAEAFGRIGSRSAVPALLTAAAVPHDRVLEHSLIYALIEIDDRDATAKGSTAASSFTRRAALIALDQMDDGGLKAPDVAPLLASTEPLLKQTASWIVSHHPDWGGALAGFFRERLVAKELGDTDRAELARQLAEFSGDQAIQELMTSTLRDAAAPAEARRTTLHAMAQANLKAAPMLWTTELAHVLGGPDATLVRGAVAAARALTIPKTNAVELTAALLRVAREGGIDNSTRLDALAAVPGGLASVDPAAFDFVRANLEPNQSVLTRSTAAGVLAKAKLSEDQLLAVTDLLKTTGPMELTRLLAAFENCSNEALGLKLVAALKASKGLASLRAETVKPRLAKFPASVQEQADQLLASLNEDAAAQTKHLDDLLATLSSGDVRRGQAVFNSQKAACSTCHAIGYLGGHVGPDLTKIGQIRTERDLLESVVYPSASFVRSFEPWIVDTKSGDEYSGVLKKDAPDEVVLATGPETVQRVARADIVEMRPGTVSVMPQGLDQTLTRQDLADLITFLKATKW
jgi:putative membrane-bound dehydrogenase-like protein